MGCQLPFKMCLIYGNYLIMCGSLPTLFSLSVLILAYFTLWLVWVSFAENQGRNVFIWTWEVSGILEIVKGELLNLENALKLLDLVPKSYVGHHKTWKLKCFVVERAKVLRFNYYMNPIDWYDYLARCLRSVIRPLLRRAIDRLCVIVLNLKNICISTLLKSSYRPIMFDTFWWEDCVHNCTTCDCRTCWGHNSLFLIKLYIIHLVIFSLIMISLMHIYLTNYKYRRVISGEGHYCLIHAPGPCIVPPCVWVWRFIVISRIKIPYALTRNSNWKWLIEVKVYITVDRQLIYESYFGKHKATVH